MCRCAVGEQVLLAWTVDVSYVLYLVRVTGWLGCFSGVCTPQNFKENLSYCIRTYLCIYHVVLRVTLFNLNAVERQISMLS